MPIQTKTTAVATLIALGTLIGLPAFAQDMQVEDPVLESVETIEAPETSFATYDLDADGSYDLDEYTSYVVASASDGDEDAKALVMSGDYATAFAALDGDADGLVTEIELTAEPEAADESYGTMDDKVSDDLEY